MPGEETILDGPVTPAPVFAYRALRGIFFTSPESSPEHDNKENLTPAYLATSSSPEKRKIMDGAVPWTPSQKRKRDSSSGAMAILSPTKGILRTPGLATPRAKFLKDINVKFKSASPEEAAKQKQQKEKIETATVLGAEDKLSRTKDGEAKGQRAAVRAPKPMHDIAPTNKAARSQSPVKAEQVPVPAKDKDNRVASNHQGTTAILSSCAIEAYMAQTEKEMKRVVKYGQKMREYARKKDAENQELKSMIEQLRRENERLLLRAHQCQSRPDLLPETQSQHEAEKKRDDKIAREPGGCVRVREEVDRVEARSQIQVNKRRSGHRAEIRIEEESRRKTNTSADSISTSTSARVASVSSSAVGKEQEQGRLRSGISTSASARRVPSASVAVAEPAKKTSSRPTGGHEEFLPLPIRSASGTASQSHMNVCAKDKTNTNTKTNTAGSTHLAPDRLAAARERLRLRAESRKASAEQQDHGHGYGYADGQKEGILIEIEPDDAIAGPRSSDRPAKHESREQSLVDWANL
jgi:type II secretory pathway component PulJ